MRVSIVHVYWLKLELCLFLILRLQKEGATREFQLAGSVNSIQDLI